MYRDTDTRDTAVTNSGKILTLTEETYIIKNISDLSKHFKKNSRNRVTVLVDQVVRKDLSEEVISALSVE
jgi:glycerol dehydrogenase-like iron-containing ADH family enzyme